MTELIKQAAQNTLNITKVTATVIVTPSTITFEEINNEVDAHKLEVAFLKSGMKSLGYCNMADIGMGKGFCLTIKY